MSKFDSSDDNLGQTKKGYALGKDSVHAKEVWNAAIEAALAKVCGAFGNDSGIADDIRKLKK